MASTRITGFPCVICGEVIYRGQTCSGACRAKLSRRTRTHGKAHAHARTPSVTSEVGQADRGQVLKDMNDATDKWITDNMKVVLEDMNNATDKLITDGMTAGQTVICENGIGIPPTVMTVTRPPCKRLDVYCHACKDEPACDYLHDQTTALPGDRDYAGVCSEVDGVWK